MDALMNFGQGVFGGAWPAVWTLLKIVLIVAPLMLGVAYLTWAERKVIGYMQVRIGPNRVGPWGLIQPIADGLKLLLKEIVVPSGANKGIFIIAPMLADGRTAGSSGVPRIGRQTRKKAEQIASAVLTALTSPPPQEPQP